jgi:hypothetical protein
VVETSSCVAVLLRGNASSTAVHLVVSGSRCGESVGMVGAEVV